MRGCPDHLPLRHLVNRVDGIDAFDSILVALMHGVDADEPGPAGRSRLASLPYRHRGRTRGAVLDPLPPIPHTVAQIVQVPDRELGQSLVSLQSEHLVFSLQDGTG